MTMGYNPKPTRHMKKYKTPKRNQKWINRMGKRFYDWESFKQSVVFPSIWVSTQIPGYISFKPGEQRYTCSHKGCETWGVLHLLERPNQYGCMWFLENLTVDHIKPRSAFPEMVFLLSNLQLLCAWHNKQKGGYYSRPAAEGVGTDDKAPID